MVGNAGSAIRAEPNESICYTSRKTRRITFWLPPCVAALLIQHCDRARFSKEPEVTPVLTREQQGITLRVYSSVLQLI